MIKRQTIVPKGQGNSYRPPQQQASRQRAAPVSRARQTQAPTYHDDLTPEEDEYDDVYPPHMPTSIRRYNVDAEGRSPAPRRRIEKHYHDEEYQSQPENSAPIYKKRFRVHWMLKAGIVFSLILIVLTLFSMASSAVGTWWQNHQDDSTYGNPRTFQIDAVVGHSDSSTSPSHFIAENLKGQIIIVEFPGGDASKARSYTVTTVPGNDSNPPVRLAFQDINRDGKLDMVILIGDPGSTVTIILFNNGTQFVSKL